MNEFLTRILWDAPPTQTISFGAKGERTLRSFRNDVAAFRSHLPGGASETNRILLAFEEDRYAFAVALISAWAQGLHVALPPNTRPQTIELIRDASRTQVIAHDGSFSRGLHVVSLLPTVKTEALERGQAPKPALHAWRSMDIAATLFSSGTTSGTSNAAPKTVAQLFTEARMLAQTLFMPHARVVSTVHPGHIYGLLYSVLAPLLAEGSFGQETPFFPQSIARDVRDYHADVLVTVPAHLGTFVSISPADFEGLKRLLSSTAPLPHELAHQIQDRFHLDVTEVLGSSETGGMAVRNSPTEEEWSALPGVELEADEEGRLRVDSPFICPTETRPYLTQERVRFVGKGFVHEGRWDRIVKIGGRRVSLPAMEAHILNYPTVQDAAIVVRDSQDLHTKRLYLAVVDPARDERALLHHFDERFERSVWPRRIVFVDSLPREANGKLQRTRLWALFEQNKNDEKHVDSVQWNLSTASTEFDAMQSAIFPLDVPSNYRWFKGHFDGHPLMAAAAQMYDLIAPAVQKYLGEGHVQHIQRIKFQQEIKPGDQLEVRLQGDASALDFTIWRDNTPCTSGRLTWEIKT